MSARQLAADLQHRVAKGCLRASLLPLDAYREAYLTELAELAAELADADPAADAHFKVLLAEHDAVIRRGQAVRDAIRDYANIANLPTDNHQLRARAEQMRRRLLIVQAYLEELSRQTVARSWRH